MLLLRNQRTLSLVSRYSNRFVSVTSGSNQTAAAAQSAPSTSRIDDIIVKLDIDVRRNGRVNARDVKLAIKELNKLDSSKSSQGLLLLKCCGSLLPEESAANRSEILRDIWNTIKAKNEGHLDISFYNALLNVYIENNEPFNPTEILAEIESQNLEPNRVTFQRLIHRYCQSGDIEGATRILEFMKSKSLPLNEAIFNSLILGYSRAGDLDSALEMTKQMTAAGVDPSNETYSTLLCSLVEHIKVKPEEQIKEKFDQLLKEAKDSDVQLTYRDFHQVVKSIAGVDQDSTLIDFTISLCQHDLGYNQDCFNVILELINSKHINAAMKLFYTMKMSNNLRESKTAGNFIIEQMVKSGYKQEEVFKICHELQDKDLNLFGISKATESALKHSDFNTAKDYLDKFLEDNVIKPRVHFYWPLLKKCTSSEQLFKLVSEDMANFAYNSTYSELNQTFVEYIWDKIPASECEIFIEKFKDVGFSHLVLLSSYLAYLLHGDQLASAIKFISQEKYGASKVASASLIRSLAEVYSRTKDVANTIKLLSIIARNGQFDKISLTYPAALLYDVVVVNGGAINSKDKIIDLVKAMVENKLNISLRDAELIANRVNADEHERALITSLGVFIQERNWSVEQDQTQRQSAEDLEKQLTELTSKGIIARGTIRQLIQSYCRQNPDLKTEEGQAILVKNRSRLEELVDACAKKNQEISNASRALLVDFYVTQCEDLDAALKMKAQIPDEFGIDDFKIVHLANLMVKKGMYKEALDLIKNENNKTRPRHAENPDTTRRRQLEREIFQLIDRLVEETKDVNLVEEMFDSVMNLTKYKPTNILLGPLIKVQLLNDNFEKAVEKYSECTQKYSLGPWKGELMKLAILKEDSTRLQKITDESVQVYGEANTFLDLCVSFLRAGKLKQAKKVITTPGLRVNQFRVNAISERLASTGEINVIEQFLLISRDLFDLNRDDLYYRLLQAYAAKNDVTKANEIWTLMQEENLTPSERTLKFLTDFFDENGKSVTFSAKN